MPRRIVTGQVVSAKGNQTAIVRVERAFKHPLFGKIVRRSKKYHAHDAANTCKEGDIVSIQECRPHSKLKTFEVVASPEATEASAS